MIQELDRWGVKFEKDGHGEFDDAKVHHMGTYVLPMPEGHDLKKCSTGSSSARCGCEVINRVMATRLLTGGRAHRRRGRPRHAAPASSRDRAPRR